MTDGFTKLGSIGGATFPCECCGRRTRNTRAVSLGSKLCPQCFELAGIENEISDGHATIAERRDTIEYLIGEIETLGGKPREAFAALLVTPVQDAPEATIAEPVDALPEWEARIVRGCTAPADAKAMIVAEYEIDKSDSMTDYFATSTERTIVLGWSGHTRDLFAEMRKYAATFPPTAHLGPGCDVWTVSVELLDDVQSNGGAYWKGSRSHWHGDLFGTEDGYSATGRSFTTEAEARAWIAEQPTTEPHAISFDGQEVRFGWTVTKKSIEHREKYSMGAGYYLKSSGTYSTGWTVSKRTLYNNERDFPKLETWTPAPVVASASAAPARVDTVTISENAEKGGIEIRFPSKPAATVLDSLKANGWRWSRFSSCWYRKDTPDARAFAQRLAGVDAGIIAADRAFARSSRVED